MRILVVSRSLPYHNKGGMEKFGLELAENLIKRGHIIEILTQKHDFKSNIPQIQINIPKLNFALNRELFIKFAHKKIRKTYDLIFSNCICNLPKNQKVIYYMHGIAPDLVFKEPKFLFRKYVFLQEKRMIKNSNKILTPTLKLKEKAIAYYKIPEEKIQVAPYGINTSLYSKKSKKKDYVLFVGSLSERKGFDKFVELSKRLKSKFAVAGDGPLKTLIDKNMNFFRVLGNKKLAALYSKSKVLVLPSLSEGLPFVLLEALASGLPVISNNFYGVDEIIKHDVNGVIADNFGELVFYAKTLTENEQKRNYLSKNAIKTAKEFDWKNIIKQYENIFESICK